MRTKTMSLAWIAVKNLKQAIKFYTEVLGMKLMETHEQFGWAELQGHDGGARLGIAQLPDEGHFKAGQNAVVTFTVENIEKATTELTTKGATCIGSVQEIPGHAKLQMAVDADGNHFQLVQILSK
ncbi:MAG: VOC family protein [Anaplasmataceae bacterium]|nr:VOC family protein [Anaplasmataceae bacterium]